MRRLEMLSAKDHVKPPPLHYDVHAALLPAGQFVELPGATNGPVQVLPPETLRSVRKSVGLRKSVSCRILRRPEWCRIKPRILSSEQPGDPFDYPELELPLELSWQPNLPMFVELWHSGRRVKGKSHRVMHNDERVTLMPGTYELKARAKENAQSYDSVWFRVAQQSEKAEATQ